MRARLVVSFVALTVIIIVVFGVPLRGFVESVERERLVATLERDAFILAGHAQETLDIANVTQVPSIQPFIEEHSQRDDARVVVTNQMGIVVGTNDPDLPVGTDFRNRPEVMQALSGVPAVGERASSTLGEDLVFVAVPVLDGDAILGVVRFSERRSMIDERVRGRLTGVAIAGLLTVIAAIALAIPVALGLARPIRRLTRHTSQLARGDLVAVARIDDGPAEVRELAGAFNSMATRLRAVMDSQREFNGVVSHQLRTPLTALRLRLEMLQASVEGGSEPAGESIDASLAEVDRLHEIIEQLLKLSRLEAGLVPLVRVDASEVATSRVEMWRPLAEERDVEIVLDAHDDGACMMIEGGLGQVIDNFIDNALGVSAAGTTIVVRVGRDSGGVVVEVVDEGPGLTDQEKTDAFQRFWRKPGSQNVPGTGLGLAIVRQIATASDAEVYFTDRDDGLHGLVAVLRCRGA